MERLPPSTGTRELCLSAAAHAFAVTSNAIGAVGVDEIAPGAAGDHVAPTVVRAHDVTAEAGEDPVATRPAGKDVVAGEPVQDVVSGEAAEDVAPDCAA